MRGQVGWNEPRFASCTGLALVGLLCGVPFLVTAVFVGGLAGTYFGVAGAIAIGVAAVAALAARFYYTEARSLRLDPVGLRLRRNGRWKTARWDEVDSCRMDLKARKLVFTAGAETISLRPVYYGNPNAIHAALRCWCDGYAITEADRDLLATNDQVCAWVDRVRQRLREQRPERPAVPVQPESYRDAAKRPEDVASDLPSLGRRYRALAVALVGTIAASAACFVAGLSGAAPTWLGLVSFGGMSVAIFVFLGLVDARWRYRVAVKRTEFLGRRVFERTRGVWESEDGTRRYRCTSADDDDGWCGPHAHHEELDRDGTTRRTFSMTRIAAWIRPSGPRASWLATVAPESWRRTCFEGPPWDPSERSGAPRHLLLQDTGDGFVLTRFDASRRYAGDTWHATRAGVELQIERELGVTVEWRELDEAPRGYAFLR